MAEIPFIPPDSADDAAFLDATIRYLDDSLSDEQLAEFYALLESDPAKVQLFVDTCLAGKLIAESLRAAVWNAHDAMPHETTPEADSPVLRQGDARDDRSKSSRSSPSITPPCIVVDSSASSSLSPALFGCLSQVGPFSYLVSALIMCVAALIAWQCKVADLRLSGGLTPGTSVAAAGNDKAVGRTPDANALDDLGSGDVHARMVARITDMVECQWAKRAPDAEPNASTSSEPELSVSCQVASGRLIGLDSGLLEMTYDTGAKVILQGPVAFQVSDSGGFLIVGKLTGKLEKAANRSNPQPPIPSPSPFAIRTPTAMVTDLGTEFGVEVDQEGRTTSHVFRGSVQLRLIGDAEEQPGIVLKENESVRVEPANGQVARVHPVVLAPDRFVRNMHGRRVALRGFNTGAGCKEQETDPHWQIVAVSNDPQFQPRSALVTTPSRRWQADSPELSQWISTTPRWQQFSPNDVTHTFRTTFELGDNVLPATAVLKGWFLADNLVRAIRLNGHDATVPEQAWNAPALVHRFTLKQGFVRGVNTLEFDVENIDLVNHRVSSPMGLRVDLEGSVREK